MRHRHDDIRILALDPSRGGFGFVVLEGASLLDWGVSFRRESEPSFVRLLESYAPDLCVTELMGSNPKRGVRARTLIDTVHRLSQERRVRVHCLSDRDVAHAMGWQKHRKYDRACDIAERFPELRSRLPAAPKPWIGEAGSYAMFDAMALALAALRHFPEMNRGRATST